MTFFDYSDEEKKEIIRASSKRAMEMQSDLVESKVTSKWYLRVWWFIGYHGLYQLNWWVKEKLGNRNMSDRTMWRRLVLKK